MHISFLFVGRISEEKGILQIISVIENLVATGNIHFMFFFIGSGPLVKTITKHHLYGTYITYYGRLPKEQTINHMEKMSYVVMPSLFLETFGLVALDALACGVPVIAESKGGLKPFMIDDALVIDDHKSLFYVMQQLLQNTTHQSLLLFKKKALKVASLYTPNKWIDKFGQLSKNCKNILLISDYAVDIGGIENYLFQIKRLLEEYHISVELVGKTKRFAGFRRKVDLITAGFNICGLFLLGKKTSRQSYDLLWLHSIQRRWGRCAVAFLGMVKNQKVWCMYHDFGLIHPFPARVYTVDQLDRAQSFLGYLQEGKKCMGLLRWWVGGFLLVSAKYIYSLWMFFLLRRVVDLHLVPSPYILLYIQGKLGNKAEVCVFPHFVSHAQDV